MAFDTPQPGTIEWTILHTGVTDDFLIYSQPVTTLPIVDKFWARHALEYENC
jgi:hypothetical protein